MYHVCTCGMGWAGQGPQPPCPIHAYQPMGQITFFPMPWECPRCKAMNGPNVDQCSCKPKEG